MGLTLAAAALGAIGMSNGSIAALALPLTGTEARAIVSLDGGIGESSGGVYLARVNPRTAEELSVPILHMYTPDNRYLDTTFLRSLDASPRWLVRIDGIRHADFLTYGALERVMPGAFGSASPGWPGSINSGEMPSRIHHTESRDKRPRAVVAKGTPLSVRMTAGNPYSSKARRKTGRAVAIAADSRPWQASRYRLKPSTSVSG